MVKRDDVTTIERRFRELSESAREGARELAHCEAAVDRARETLERAKRDLAISERTAKERRQAQHDAVRGRAELERRLAELTEAESVARSRRQQAEQRAEGFRAAAAFAASSRSEANGTQDPDRFERERLVEDRAIREAAAAEARAAEALAEETKIGRLRAEIAGHVEAERDIEQSIARERADAERRIAELQATIETVTAELAAAQEEWDRLLADRDRRERERAEADQQLHEVSRRARDEIEARIAELKAIELGAARERAEKERLLAELIGAERAAEKELAEAKRREAMELARERRRDARLHDDVVHPFEDRSVLHVADLAALEAETERAAAAAEAPSNGVAHRNADAPHDRSSNGMSSDEGYGVSSDGIASAYSASGDALRDDAFDCPSADHDERLPGLRSFFGKLSFRRQAEEPPTVEEGPSVAERIARDFGLLGVPADEETHVPAPSPLEEAL
jgi:hypothetical protein